MAGTPKILGQFVLGSGNILFLTVPVSKRWVVSMFHVSNTDTVQRAVRLNHVLAADGAVAVKNRIVPDSALPNGDFMEFWGGAVLNASDTIWGLSDATG